jgi:hypothetical protein
MTRSSIVPFGSFLIAVAIAALVPSTRNLGRAAGEATGCTVSTTCDPTLDFRPKTLGTDSIRDEKKKDLKDENTAGLQAMGVKTKDIKDEINDTVKDVQKKELDAVTHSDVDASWKSTPVDNTKWTVDVTCKFSLVIVLPANASETLKSHEEGHKLIAEKTKEFAKTKFKTEIDKASCDNASIGAAFDSAWETIKSVFKAANDDYDDKTKNGKQGTAAQQLTQAAASFAAASAGK